MLKPGARAIVKSGERVISVRAGANNYNVLEYGISALSNDFKDEILFRAALEDARTPADVLQACKRYARYPGTQHCLVTDY